MSVYLFTALFYLVLFLLVMCGTLCGQVRASGNQISGQSETVELFQKEIKQVLKPDETRKIDNVKVENYYSPAFVSVSSVFVVLAATNGTEKIDNNITVLSNYIDTKNELNWGEKVVSENPEWTARFAVYGDCTNNNCVDSAVARGLVAAVKAGKIYLLSVNATTTPSDSPHNGAYTLKFGLAVGTVSTDKKVTWEKEKPLNLANQKLTDHFKEQTLSKGVFFGSAIVPKEKNILFLLKAQTRDKQTVLGFYFPNGVGKANDLKPLSFDEVAQNCYPQFFLWDNKVIMVPTHCKGGVSNQEVKATADFTKEPWVDSPEPFSHLAGFFHDKNDFTTVTIQTNTNNNDDVLLFTQKKQPKQQTPCNNDKCDVYLWATDGKRFYNAGKFLNDVNVTSINLLYANNELLALYQQWDESGPKNIFLKRLKTQLSDITTVIEAWKKNPDETVKKLCDDKVSCTFKLTTENLVGFLSNNNEGTKTWKDEYYYVNATIKLKPNDNTNNKVEKVTGGFRFSGAGVGAKWLEGKEEKEDQPYKLTDPGFTLVATVTVGSDTNGNENSILGVSLTGEPNYFGLWCTTGGKWVVKNKDGKTIAQSTDINCTPDKLYYVAFVLKTKEISVYVNGHPLSKLNNEKMDIGQSKNIAHFYFGADKDTTNTDVNITNVLLYNRPFDEVIIQQVKPKEKIVTDAQPTTGNGNTDQLTADKTETDSSLQKTSPTKDEKEPQSSSSPPPPTTEDSAARVGVVGVLCFMLFGVFTLLGRYVH